MSKILLVSIVFGFVLYATSFSFLSKKTIDTNTSKQKKDGLLPSPKPTIKTGPELIIAPSQKILETDYHVFQTFNNCGPAALSMMLRFYGVTVSQEELGLSLRPYQNAQGINDDKSVTLAEIAEKSKEYGFFPYHRPNGNIEIIKNLISYDMPVLTRTWTKADEDIGHYRVVKGYDENTKEIIQDDSLQGKNLRYTYAEFNILWEKFNFEYLVFVPKNKIEIVERILADNTDEEYAWQNAASASRRKLVDNPDDMYARFNLAVALYNIGDYQGSVAEYEKTINHLPFRTLWYQIEPILAYYKIGNYDKVIEASKTIFDSQNPSYSELYFLRGAVFEKQGESSKSQEEFAKATAYNTSFYWKANLKNIQ